MAQLGARLNGIQKVRGSNPLGSTKATAYLKHYNRRRFRPSLIAGSVDLKTTSNRRLRLSRETLRNIGTDDMSRAAGGKLTQTCYSCLTYVSCDFVRCVVTDAISGGPNACY